MNAIQCEYCKEIYTANKPLILSECLVCGHKHFEEVEANIHFSCDHIKSCFLCGELYVDNCPNCDKYLPVTLDKDTLLQYPDLDEFISGVITKDHTLILDDGESKLTLTEEDYELYDLGLYLDLEAFTI